jgi:hypothetical protein
MSRSYKKPIVKIKGIYKDIYWRIVRRVQKQQLRNDNLQDKKTIINDWDYIDYISICNEEECRCVVFYGRKKCKEK